MNIFKNLMFLQGHFVDPNMDEDYGQKYGVHAEQAEAEMPAERVHERARIDATRKEACAPTSTSYVRARAAKAAVAEDRGEIEYLDVYYTSR